MHQIRLRGPWKEANTDIADGGDGLWFERKFHRPTGIEGLEVQLQIDVLLDSQRLAAAQLNGNELELPPQVEVQSANEIPITSQLQPFNVLRLQFADSDANIRNSDSHAQPSEISFATMAAVSLVICD